MKQIYFRKFGLNKTLRLQFTYGSSFVVPLFLIAISTDYIKSRIKDFKSLNQNTRWPLYILLFGVWDLMIGFAYLLFSYFEISHVTMILANGLFITGTYLTFLSFSLREDCKSQEKANLWQKKF